jgi:hypothetical protein
MIFIILKKISNNCFSLVSMGEKAYDSLGFQARQEAAKTM